MRSVPIALPAASDITLGMWVSAKAHKTRFVLFVTLGGCHANPPHLLLVVVAVAVVVVVVFYVVFPFPATPLTPGIVACLLSATHRYATTWKRTGTPPR